MAITKGMMSKTVNRKVPGAVIVAFGTAALSHECRLAAALGLPSGLRFPLCNGLVAGWRALRRGAKGALVDIRRRRSCSAPTNCQDLGQWKQATCPPIDPAPPETPARRTRMARRSR